MRYSELMEGIKAPPLNIGAYVQNRIKKLKDIQSRFDDTSSKISKLRDASEYLYKISRHSSGMVDFDYFIDYHKRFDDRLELSSLINSLERFYNGGGNNSVDAIVSIIASIRGFDDDVMTDTLKEISNVKSNLENEYGDGQEVNDGLELASVIKEFISLVRETEKLYNDIESKMKQVQKVYDAHYSEKPYRPDHDEVETLYHATAFATEILENGFSAEKPLDRSGLGNLGTQKTISFTHSYKVAQDIMRTFRELWMIVHGKLSAKDIVSWIEKEGIDKREVASMADLKMDHDLRTVKDTLTLMNMYRGYIAYSKIRTDPVFGDFQKVYGILKNREYDDIGILKCEVEIGDSEYLKAEAEFRVNPEQVKSIKRLV